AGALTHAKRSLGTSSRRLGVKLVREGALVETDEAQPGEGRGEAGCERASILMAERRAEERGRQRAPRGLQIPERAGHDRAACARRGRFIAAAQLREPQLQCGARLEGQPILEPPV